MLGCARPVRMMLKSSLATVTALSIFSSASRRVSSIIVRLRYARHAYVSLVRVATSVGHWLPVNKRADLLAADGPDDVPFAHQGEHDDRQPVVHAQADRRGVHYLELAAEVLTVIQ